MNPRTGVLATLFTFFVGLLLAIPAYGGQQVKKQGKPPVKPQVTLVDRKPDPYGSPRPARDAHNVPLGTSFYFELGLQTEAKGDKILPESVGVQVQAQGGESIDILRPGRQFADRASGWLRVKQGLQGANLQTVDFLTVYVDPGRALKPATTYTVRVQARSRRGAELGAAAGTWTFATEAAPAVHTLKFPLDLGAEPVRWHGRFFSGICNVVFCTKAEVFGSTYEMMSEARKHHPRAWSYQRDIWLTGTEDRRPPWALFLDPLMPNMVRERETRRIAAMKDRPDGVLLTVEDFFGHQQYGVPAGRPVSEDYHPGDEVLIADGIHDATTKVLAVDDQARTVMVGPIAAPAGGWKVAYDGPLPTSEDPDAPGLFPEGGCYLRKFRPHGTPCYYWGRLDKEFDLAHTRHGRRLAVDFVEAPIELSLNGRDYTGPKDYVEWNEVVRTVTGHLIDRYGKESLDFTWTVFNEPDLLGTFFRMHWDETQRFYDYTVDAILRAFEDRGYDSDKVFIGGLELGGIFGTNLRLTEFLAHCSPRASAKGALALNAAFEDQRLEGKRSRRVETLCRAHGGKGSPCDFVSVHTYNRSDMMAAKLIRAKEMALQIDPEYYRDLWINSHETCPDWSPPMDTAAADSYLGNGYFPSWTADVVARQLSQAARDPRYGFGETVLTIWPPVANFAGLNTVSRMISCDDDGDGRSDRKVTIPSPIFHVLGMLSDLGDRYWVVPQQHVGGHVVSGFASRDERNVVRVVLCAHHAEDPQSRSEAQFDVALELERPGWEGPARVEEYRFDKDHNTYFQKARSLRDRHGLGADRDAARVERALEALEVDDVAAQREALKTLEDLGPSAGEAAAPALMKLAAEAKDQAIREAAQGMLKRLSGFHAGFPRQEVEEIQKLAQCRLTNSATIARQPDGRLCLTARVAGNGLNVLVIEPAVGQQTDQPKR